MFFLNRKFEINWKFLDHLFLPYKFYGSGVSGIRFYTFASCDPWKNNKLPNSKQNCVSNAFLQFHESLQSMHLTINLQGNEGQFTYQHTEVLWNINPRLTKGGVCNPLRDGGLQGLYLPLY